jgi:hypothetical protein
LKIKKQLKKEESKRKRIIAVSIAIALLMPYAVGVFSGEGLFVGWEIYFAYAYMAFVDLLLIMNILRTLSESRFDFTINNQKVRIKDSIMASPVSIHLDKILFVDVSERPQGDFEILIIVERGKRSRGFMEFGSEFVKVRASYRTAYNYLTNAYPGKKYYCFAIKKAGSKKYYYLYLLYKNAYDAHFSENAVGYVKSFVEEYNLS